jgi:hypothetical protein
MLPHHPQQKHRLPLVAVELHPAMLLKRAPQSVQPALAATNQQMPCVAGKMSVGRHNGRHKLLLPQANQPDMLLTFRKAMNPAVERCGGFHPAYHQYRSQPGR